MKRITLFAMSMLFLTFSVIHSTKKRYTGEKPTPPPPDLAQILSIKRRHQGKNPIETKKVCIADPVCPDLNSMGLSEAYDLCKQYLWGIWSYLKD